MTSNAFADRTVLVTGAAGDIGRAVSIRLAAEGATVLAADHQENERLVATVERCRRAGGSARPLAFDVTDEAEVDDVFNRLAADGVTVDGLVNNAGVQGPFSNIVDATANDLRGVLEVNVIGVFNVLRAFARSLNGVGGTVVNTASMAKGGAPNMAAYSASKAAVVALTVTAAKDLAASGIRVNSVSPAFIGPGDMWDRQVALQAETPSQYFADDPDVVAQQMLSSVPMRRYGSLDEVASVIRFLLSDESSYITGFDIEVSGGAV